MFGLIVFFHIIAYGISKNTFTDEVMKENILTRVNETCGGD